MCQNPKRRSSLRPAGPLTSCTTSPPLTMSVVIMITVEDSSKRQTLERVSARCASGGCLGHERYADICLPGASVRSRSLHQAWSRCHPIPQA